MTTTTAVHEMSPQTRPPRAWGAARTRVACSCGHRSMWGNRAEYEAACDTHIAWVTHIAKR